MIDTILAVLFASLAVVQAIALGIFFFPQSKSTRKHSPPLSVIVPAYNEAGFIKNTVQSILSADYRGKKEILVIDDGSTDHTVEEAKSIRDPRVKIYQKQHAGKAAAVNYGISKARFETIALLDADSSLDKKALQLLVQPLADGADVSTGVIRAKRTRNPLTWFQDIDYMVSSGWRYICSKINATYIAPGFAAFRKSALEKVGNFDNDTLTEDLDIVIKMRKAGYKAAMVPAAVMTTSVPSTFYGLVRQRLRWGRGSLQVAKKHSDVFFMPGIRTVSWYAFPMHLFWYAFAILYIPFALYVLFSSYLATASGAVSTLIFAAKWFTIYGIADLIFSTAIGSYQMNFLIGSIIASWAVSFAYLLLLIRKFSGGGWKIAVGYLIIFPYYWLLFFVQAVALLHETVRHKKKGSNIWEKVN